MHNRRLDFFLRSRKVAIGEKTRTMKSPNRYVSGNLYIPAEFILSRDFANFAEIDAQLDEENNLLTLEDKVNIISPRYYVRETSTRVLFELLEDIPYFIDDKDPRAVTISFPRGRISKDTIGIENGAVKEIVLENRGREAFVTFRLDAGSRGVQVRMLSNPRRLEVTVQHVSGTAAPISAVASAPVETLATVASTPTVTAPVIENSSSTATIVASTPAAAPSVSAMPEAVVSSSSAAQTVTASSAPTVSATAPAAAVHKRRIVLDAGHGGGDTGAIGYSGTYEKDINLTIIKELKKIFEEDGGYEVMLTRSDDTFIRLDQRSSLANEKRADLFVSVHCNASLDKSTSGFEIYFLSEKASDKQAAATEILENSVLRLEEKPTGKQAMLQRLLWSMVVNEFINESSEICSLITSEIVHRSHVEDRGVKQAGFYVLRGTQMPAVLVECAFISNQREEARLRSRKYQRQIADSIYEGIKRYEMRKTTVKR
jgi:N-acetylmuramoyl-L-alanine amidase